MLLREEEAADRHGTFANAAVGHRSHPQGVRGQRELDFEVGGTETIAAEIECHSPFDAVEASARTVDDCVPPRRPYRSKSTSRVPSSDVVDVQLIGPLPNSPSTARATTKNSAADPKRSAVHSRSWNRCLHRSADHRLAPLAPAAAAVDPAKALKDIRTRVLFSPPGHSGMRSVSMTRRHTAPTFSPFLRACARIRSNASSVLM